ncbi:GNAT family N-acetyltransferase [Acutalibacter sp. 1XD8-33]|uniref:GNAT family N-acetyltransferase n=1 Tax=Acutalibacter sp. 1XD8-33 TaxID=2320081 RepID=UPI001FA9C0E9|nr:GNAT family protein [Acutalibacter sp. 1XD8-33]
MDDRPMLSRKDVLEIVRGLDFMDSGDCWLTSGAALVLFGVRETTHDVDLICTSALADRLEARGVPFRRDGLGGARIFAYGQDVELLEDWDTEEVVTVEGLRSASLLSIRKQKEKLGREKDLRDIALIDRFLRKSAGKIRLETERLVLRDYLPQDEEEYYQLKSHEGTMGRYMGDIMVHSREEARADFANVLADQKKPDRTFYFLRAELKEGGRQIGSVGYTVEGRTPVGKLVHGGYFYFPEFWGKGYGTEAFREVIRFAFLEDGVYRFSTGCLQENRGSERIMQKCGMVREAERVDWVWHGGQMKTRLEYRLLRREYDAWREIFPEKGAPRV